MEAATISTSMGVAKRPTVPMSTIAPMTTTITILRSIQTARAAAAAAPHNHLRSTTSCSSRRRRIALIAAPYSPIRMLNERKRHSGRWSAAAAAVGSSSSSSYPEPEEEDEVEEVLKRALEMEGSIPNTSNEFVRTVSTPAYHLRRQIIQTIDSLSYDVLETNPWRDRYKPVYVLTRNENQLCTMKTRRTRSEVERELSILFSGRGRKQASGINSLRSSTSGATRFQMLVEDIRDGVLVFEDEYEAIQYCDLLEGGGQGCEGVAELEASSVFDICQKMRALAVLFRRGAQPPLPKSLEQNLGARKRSLEDQ